MNPLRNLIERLVAWNHKPQFRSAVEVAQLLQGVADGSAADHKIDGFIYIPIGDPHLEQLREEFGAMYGPGFDPTAEQFVSLVRQASALAEDEGLKKVVRHKPAPDKPE